LCQRGPSRIAPGQNEPAGVKIREREGKLFDNYLEKYVLKRCPILAIGFAENLSSEKCEQNLINIFCGFKTIFIITNLTSGPLLANMNEKPERSRYCPRIAD